MFLLKCHLSVQSVIIIFFSQSGLKVHKTKKNINSHSYKLAKFKCDDCDFVGESELTMEVHIGKHHSETYECGLCDVET